MFLGIVILLILIAVLIIIRIFNGFVIMFEMFENEVIFIENHFHIKRITTGYNNYGDETSDVYIIQNISGRKNGSSRMACNHNKTDMVFNMMYLGLCGYKVVNELKLKDILTNV